MVKANSTGIYVVPQRTSRAGGTYAERLERRLRAGGFDAEVVNESTAWERASDALPEWFGRMVNYCPDVVVFNFGGAEAQPSVIPMFFLKWLGNRRSMGPLGPFRRRLARVIDPRLRRFVSRLMRRLYPRLGLRTWRTKPERFEAEYVRLIRLTRSYTSGLVLILTLTPTTDLIERFMPGLTARYARINESIRSVVAEVDDPFVQLIDVEDAIKHLDLSVTVHDGLHLSAEGHDSLAAKLEEAVVRWIDTGALTETGEPSENGSGKSEPTID